MIQVVAAGCFIVAGAIAGWHAHRIYVADLKAAVRRATSKRR
jgi:hypothetical protein